MLLISYSKGFEKSLVKLVQANLVRRKEVEEVIQLLREDKGMSARYRDHALKGKMVPLRECHVRGDILLVYEIINRRLVLSIVDIGTHAQLFG